MKTALLLLLPALLAAQVVAPRTGSVRLANSVVNVLGIPGNLLVGRSAFPAAEAAAFSDRYGLLATAGEVRLVKTDGSILAAFPYRGDAPVLNIDQTPETALAWLPSEQTILVWQNDRFETVYPNERFSSVTSVSLVSSKIARLLFSNPDRTVSTADISLPDGSTRNVSLLPGVLAPAYSFGGRVISLNEQGLAVEHSGAADSLPAPPGPFTAERMSANWVHLSFPASHSHYALHLSATPTLSQIPAQVSK